MASFRFLLHVYTNMLLMLLKSMHFSDLYRNSLGLHACPFRPLSKLFQAFRSDASCSSGTAATAFHLPPRYSSSGKERDRSWSFGVLYIRHLVSSTGTSSGATTTIKVGWGSTLPPLRISPSSSTCYESVSCTRNS